MAENVLDSGPPSAKRPKLSSPALSASANDGNDELISTNDPGLVNGGDLNQLHTTQGGGPGGLGPAMMSNQGVSFGGPYAGQGNQGLGGAGMGPQHPNKGPMANSLAQFNMDKKS
nr:histone acetyltransferase p300-like [Syngnathus scovelli]